jgi:hypothetical protein
MPYARWSRYIRKVLPFKHALDGFLLRQGVQVPVAFRRGLVHVLGPFLSQALIDTLLPITEPDPPFCESATSAHFPNWIGITDNAILPIQKPA